MFFLNNCDKDKISDWINQWNSEQSSFDFFTSGSTGIPKTISISRNQLTTSAKLTLNTLNLQKGDSMLINLNTDFIAGKMMLIRGIIGEMDIYITEPSSNPLLDLNPDQHFDFLSFVPIQIETILTKTPEKITILNKAKAIIIGGAPISNQLHGLIQAIEVPVFHTYGMTETVSHIALKRLNGEHQSEYFETLKGITISTDNRNCLVVNHDITNHQNIVTNDVIELISDSKFKWLGRADDIINSGGIKLLPNQIELKINSIFELLNLNNKFFIFGLPHQKLGTSINLLIEENEAFNSEKLASLESHLKNNLTKYELPKKIYFKDKFVETPTLKIDKKQTIHSLGIEH